VGVADACVSYVAGKNSVSNDFYAIFNAGTTTVTPVARKLGTGTVSVTNPYMNIAAIRWS
jgi:translation initiation factor 2B subunit (eIF-2B alpha/beta/delta family)